MGAHKQVQKVQLLHFYHKEVIEKYFESRGHQVQVSKTIMIQYV